MEPLSVNWHKWSVDRDTERAKRELAAVVNELIILGGVDD